MGSHNPDVLVKLLEEIVLLEDRPIDIYDDVPKLQCTVYCAFLFQLSSALNEN